jgi:hypothetical protein
MEFYNNLTRKVTQNKIFFPVAIALFYAFYLISSGSTPFGDDYVYIFKNSHITSTSHPFVFWNLKSESYKAWPFTYTVLWILFKIFGSKFILYRLTNATIHLFNAYLVKRISDDFNKDRSKFIFLIFLFHPLVVENIFWIFQLKTLLATSFILGAYIYLKNSVKISFFFFILSLYTKSIAVFFPFIVPSKTRSLKRNILIVIPFIIISIYVGVQNIKGITASSSNTINIREFYSDKPNYELDKQMTKENIQIQDNRKEMELAPKFYNYFISFFPQTIESQVLGQKVFNFFSHLGFYIKSSLGLSKSWLVYPSFSKIQHFIHLIFCLLFFLIFYFSKRLREPLLASLVFYIPTSGIFYVPYMEHSPVADHWFYTSLAFLMIAMFNLDFKTKKITLMIFSIFICLFVSKTLNNNFRLKNTSDYFFENLKEAPRSKILLEYLIQIEIEKENFRSAIILAKKLLSEAHNKVPIYKTLLFLHSEIGDKDSFQITRKRYLEYLDSLGLNDYRFQEEQSYFLPR